MLSLLACAKLEPASRVALAGGAGRDNPSPNAAKYSGMMAASGDGPPSPSSFASVRSRLSIRGRTGCQSRRLLRRNLRSPPLRRLQDHRAPQIERHILEASTHLFCRRDGFDSGLYCRSFFTGDPNTVTLPTPLRRLRPAYLRLEQGEARRRPPVPGSAVRRERVPLRFPGHLLYDCGPEPRPR